MVIFANRYTRIIETTAVERSNFSVKIKKILINPVPLNMNIIAVKNKDAR